MSGPPRPFVALPCIVLDDVRLDNDAKCLYAHYVRSMGWAGRRYVKPDRETARAVGLGLSKLRSERRALEQCGYIRCDIRGGMAVAVELLSPEKTHLQQTMGLGPMAATPPQNNAVPHRKTTHPALKYGAPPTVKQRGSNTNLRSTPDLYTDLPQYLTRQERSERSRGPHRKTVHPAPRNNAVRESLSRRLVERIARHA